MQMLDSFVGLVKVEIKTASTLLSVLDNLYSLSFFCSPQVSCTS